MTKGTKLLSNSFTKKEVKKSLFNLSKIKRKMVKMLRNIDQRLVIKLDITMLVWALGTLVNAFKL